MILVLRLFYYLRSIFTLLTGITNWPTVIAAFVGLPLEKPFAIQLRSTGLRFKVRSPMDIWIVKETCLDRDYERISVPIQNGCKVVDIGAGVGDFSIDTARCNPLGIVHAYEPFSGSFELLKQNVLLNHMENVMAFPEAISDHAGTLQLELSGAAVQHSTARTVLEQGSVAVPAITLSKVLSRLEGGRCDLLKMDCEGAEYGILMNSGDDCWPCIGQIVMEYHDGVTSFSHQDLAAFFEKRGFKVRSFPSKVQRDLGFLHILMEPKDS
jgi:FkbM family methyltransferase